MIFCFFLDWVCLIGLICGRMGLVIGLVDWLDLDWIDLVWLIGWTWIGLIWFV